MCIWRPLLGRKESQYRSHTFGMSGESLDELICKGNVYSAMYSSFHQGLQFTCFSHIMQRYAGTMDFVCVCVLR